jgi:hypothetical protein
MRLFKLKCISLLLIAFIAFSQTACVNLVGLREFIDKSVKAGSKFKGIINDSYRSCAVALYYRRAITTEFEDFKPFDSPKAFLDTVPEMQKRECERTSESAKNFIGANKVLMTYLYVMGQLAGDGLTNTDEEFTALRGAIAEIPGGDNAIVAPAINLANTITNIILESKRQKALKEIISRNNGNVTTLILELSKSLDIYLERLDREKNRLKEMHETANNLHISLYRTTDETKPKFDALQILSGGSSLEDKIQKINEKISAAKAYKEILSSIQKGHQELYVEANRGFNKKNAVRIALKYAPSIQTNYDEIIKIF